LSGCIGFARPQEKPASGRGPLVADSETVRRLMGQAVLDRPLLPQPGDIWADVLPAAEPGPADATPTAGQGGHRSVVAAAPSAGVPRLPPPVVVAAAPEAGVPPAVAATTKAAPPGDFRLMVQLAAAGSAQRAVAEWQRLRQHAPKLTDGHLPAVSEAEVNGQHVWRLRAAGFADVAEASAFCSGIRAVKASCWVVPPSASP
jgi:hypothetical protein